MRRWLRTLVLLGCSFALVVAASTVKPESAAATTPLPYQDAAYETQFTKLLMGDAEYANFWSGLVQGGDGAFVEDLYLAGEKAGLRASAQALGIRLAGQTGAELAVGAEIGVLGGPVVWLGVTVAVGALTTYQLYKVVTGLLQPETTVHPTTFTWTSFSGWQYDPFRDDGPPYGHPYIFSLQSAPDIFGWGPQVTPNPAVCTAANTACWPGTFGDSTQQAQQRADSFGIVQYRDALYDAPDSGIWDDCFGPQSASSSEITAWGTPGIGFSAPRAIIAWPEEIGICALQHVGEGSVVPEVYHGSTVDAPHPTTVPVIHLGSVTPDLDAARTYIDTHFSSPEIDAIDTALVTIGSSYGTIEMPDCTGMTFAGCRLALRNAGLLGQITPLEGDPAPTDHPEYAGKVQSTDPGAGEDVDIGTYVRVNIWRTPDGQTAPNPFPNPDPTQPGGDPDPDNPVGTTTTGGDTIEPIPPAGPITPDTSIDFGPLNDLDPGCKFPYGFVCYAQDVTAWFDVTPDAPRFEMTIARPSLFPGSGDFQYTVDLNIMDDYMSVIRTLFSIVLWVGAVYVIATRLLGFHAAGDPGEAIDDG